MRVTLSWSNLLGRTWSTCVLLVALAHSVSTMCPRDVSSATGRCFKAYNSNLQHVKRSREMMCCGVDVEVLRAFCQSYVGAMQCVDGLRYMCPKDSERDIAAGMSMLQGAQESLHELCEDDKIIENYAMHQHCFREIGDSSKRCFSRHMNMSTYHTNIRFLSSIDIRHKDVFCRDMRSVVQCVTRTVRRNCGESAARLAEVLVKPMVRQSSDCDYSVITQKPTRQPQSNPAYISDGHKTRDTAGNTDGIRNKGRPLLVSFISVVFAPLVALLFGTLNPS